MHSRKEGGWKKSMQFKITPYMGIRLAQMNMSERASTGWIIAWLDFERPADNPLGCGLHISVKQISS